MMWVSPLYTVNMLYCHWLMNKAVSANGLAEQSQSGNLNRDIEREQAE